MILWSELENDITSCRACPRLVAWREEVARVKRRAYRDEDYWGKPVPGFGDRHAHVLVIGLAPAAHGANRTGRMFTGDSSGDFLYAALHRAGFASQPTSRHRDDGLTLRNVFISAACRCAPPGNKPTLDEIAACRPFLEREIALLPDLRVVVALGRVAFDAALRQFTHAEDAASRPTFGHTATYPLADGRWLVASYHPSRQNTQTGRLTTEMFDRVWTQVKHAWHRIWLPDPSRARIIYRQSSIVNRQSSRYLMPETQQVIYSMVRVGRVYPPNRQVLRDISLGFFYGAKIGVLGLNGAGKSSLLRIMAGVDDEYLGETMLSKGYTRGLLEQEPALDTSKTVRQVVEEAVQPIVDLLRQYDEVSAQFSEPDADYDKLIEAQGRLQEQLDKQDAWNLDNRLEQAMDALRCPPGDMPIAVLSGGERRRVALCRLLLTEPDILLLDEPTNHLDAESVAWLEKHLQAYQGTVIAVTHDRYFLDNVAEWILELDRGYGIPWRGNYSSWLEQKQDRLRREEKADVRRIRTLERELDWIRMSPRARQAKGRARVTAYEKLLSQETEERREEMQIYIPPGPRLGDVVIDFTGVSKAYGDRLLFEDVSFQVPPGAVVGVIGPNGAGKTTLLRLTTGQEQPTSGAVTVGQTVALGYVDQSRDTLDADKTVWQEISGGEEILTLGARKMNSRAYVGGFNFIGSDQQKRVGDLSGGERNRVHLAKVLKGGANVLLLDEPTNDLDVNTLRALEEALDDFAGSAIVVSHDRWFLDRICTHIIAFEEDGGVRWFVGNCADYEADRRKRLGIAAETPHRLVHRRLTR